LTGDIRLAKRLLLSIAEKSDSRLDISKMAEAITENEKFMWEREIRKLSIELRLTLLAVIEANRFYEKKRETFVTANLKRFIFSSRIEPNLKNIYKHYCLICEEYGFNPKSEITFRNSIDELDRQMLIRKEVKGLGRGKGVTSLVYLRGYADVLEPIIRKSIDEAI
jgi:Cdc6-like AAA superfamily ATPase